MYNFAAVSLTLQNVTAVFLTRKRRKRKRILGQIPEWPNGADCKSAGLRLRWFESIFAHEKRNSCCYSSAVEHFLGKEEVPGSSPGNSSK